VTEVVAIIERSGSRWVGHLEQDPQTRSVARSLAKVHERLLDAAALSTKVERDSIALVPTLVGLDDVHAAIAEVHYSRQSLFAAQDRLASATREAATLMVHDYSISFRDVGGFLGLSHQRIHQILNENG
jgi:hypothetical protein